VDFFRQRLAQYKITYYLCPRFQRETRQDDAPTTKDQRKHFFEIESTIIRLKKVKIENRACTNKKKLATLHRQIE
jgi:hypothetical protein